MPTPPTGRVYIRPSEELGQNRNRQSSQSRKSASEPRREVSSPARTPGNLAGVVAAGILLSRIAGLIRESIFAHYLGNSAAADAFKAGFRIPNILQNLFGEGVLSASFIPVYSRLLGEGDDETADLVAWAVGAMLALVTSILVALGVLAAPY